MYIFESTQPKIDKKQLKIGRMQPVEFVYFELKGEILMKLNLAENLKKIRKENNLSQEQLAEKLGVSRQSVSKWEAGQAYPEMDKVLQICKLFNLNMDELFNQDVKEVNEVKESKANVNRYIDDFLDFITKTIDMFSSLRFKEKIKCLFEQVLLTGIFGLGFLFIGVILINFVRSILRFLPDSIFWGVMDVFENVYLIVALFLGVALLLHIFKTRYLDYYEIVKVKSDESDEKTEKEELTNISINENTNDSLKTSARETTKNKKHKILLEKRKERIVIRDPKHSGYKFISGLLRCFLFLVKAIVFCIAMLFSLSLIALVTTAVISFAFIKTGFLFAGVLTILTAAILINLIILYSNYNFLMSRKSKKGRMAITFLIALVLAGFGIAFTVFGFSKLEYIDDIENAEYYVSNYETIEMTEDTNFEFYWHEGIEYVPSKNEDIKIECRNSNCYEIELVKIDEEQDYYQLQLRIKENDWDICKKFLEDIKKLKIVDYSQAKVTIYTTEENIEKLKNNARKRREEEQARETQNIIKQYEQRIQALESELYEEKYRTELN